MTDRDFYEWLFADIDDLIDCDFEQSGGKKMQTDRDRLIELLIDSEIKYAQYLYEECDKAIKGDITKQLFKRLEFYAAHLLANSVIVQEWIPVENKLPDVRENPVLVSYGGGVWMAWRHKGWWELPSGLKTNYVTHWMPLPKPPKEAEAKLRERKEDEGK